MTNPCEDAFECPTVEFLVVDHEYMGFTQDASPACGGGDG